MDKEGYLILSSFDVLLLPKASWVSWYTIYTVCNKSRQEAYTASLLFHVLQGKEIQKVLFYLNVVLIIMQAKLKPASRWVKCLWLPLIRAAKTNCASSISCTITSIGEQSICAKYCRIMFTINRSILLIRVSETCWSQLSLHEYWGKLKLICRRLECFL